MKKILSLLLSINLTLLAMPVAALESVSLQLRWLHQAQFAGFYMAKAKGFYRDAGLNVTIRAGGNSKVPINEVLDRNADFGVGNTEVLVATDTAFLSQPSLQFSRTPPPQCLSQNPTVIFKLFMI